MTHPNSPPRSRSVRCTAFTRAGNPCKAWAVRGSDPPRCSLHAIGRPPGGGRPGSQNARTHGAYPGSIAPGGPENEARSVPVGLKEHIADLERKIAVLSQYIDPHLHSLDLDGYARVLHLHGLLTLRLGRLLRDPYAFTNDGTDGLETLINTALAELGRDLGVDL